MQTLNKRPSLTCSLATLVLLGLAALGPGGRAHAQDVTLATNIGQPYTWYDDHGTKDFDLTGNLSDRDWEIIGGFLGTSGFLLGSTVGPGGALAGFFIGAYVGTKVGAAVKDFLEFISDTYDTHTRPFGIWIDGGLAQEFTTGSNSFGYDMSSVAIYGRYFPDQRIEIPPSLSLWSSSNGVPGVLLYTLPFTKWGNDGSYGLRLEYQAPVAAILEPGTRYVVVIGYLDQTRVVITSSPSEDAGSLAGWSIGNILRKKNGAVWGSLVPADAGRGIFPADGTPVLRTQIRGTSLDSPPTMLEGHTSFVTSVAFSPDGTTLASGSSDRTYNYWIGSPSNDYTVKFWDVGTGAKKAALEGHAYGVWSVSFSSDGTTLASGSRDKTVQLWDVATRTNIATLKGHTEAVTSVAFSPDGTLLASGSSDDTVKLWDVATGTNIATLEGHTEKVSSLSFSPDETLLASGSFDGTVRLWDVSARAHVATLEGHAAGVRSVSFSPDSTTLASGADDYTVKLWDVATRTNIATLEGHRNNVTSVSFSPDGTTLASGSFDDTVKLWDVATGTNIATLEGHTEKVFSVSFSPDGTTLASGSHKTVRLWDVSEWTLSLRVFVSMVKVGEGQFKAKAHVSVPFEIVLPLSVTNGSISGGASSITITAGAREQRYPNGIPHGWHVGCRYRGHRNVAEASQQPSWLRAPQIRRPTARSVRWAHPGL